MLSWEAKTVTRPAAGAFPLSFSAPSYYTSTLFSASILLYLHPSRPPPFFSSTLLGLYLHPSLPPPFSTFTLLYLYLYLSPLFSASTLLYLHPSRPPPFSTSIFLHLYSSLPLPFFISTLLCLLLFEAASGQRSGCHHDTTGHACAYWHVWPPTSDGRLETTLATHSHCPPGNQTWLCTPRAPECATAVKTPTVKPMASAGRAARGRHLGLASLCPLPRAPRSSLPRQSPRRPACPPLYRASDAISIAAQIPAAEATQEPKRARVPRLRSRRCPSTPKINQSRGAAAIYRPTQHHTTCDSPPSSSYPLPCTRAPAQAHRLADLHQGLGHRRAPVASSLSGLPR